MNSKQLQQSRPRIDPMQQFMGTLAPEDRAEVQRLADAARFSWKRVFGWALVLVAAYSIGTWAWDYWSSVFGGM